MRFALFPVWTFARFAHGSSLMKTVTKCDEKNIIYEACDCFLGVFYFMRQSCVESAINALEVHGLDKCLDHGIDAFERYVGLAVLSRSIQKLGTIKRNMERLRLLEEQQKLAA